MIRIVYTNVLVISFRIPNMKSDGVPVLAIINAHPYLPVEQPSIKKRGGDLAVNQGYIFGRISPSKRFAYQVVGFNPGI
jgi:hypothetical protein